jgi:DnaK suppressor protein
LSTFSNRDEIVIETTADDMDRLQQQLNTEIVLRNLDNTSKVLRSIQVALDRIGDDMYGLCIRCEEPISERRLKAVPWASNCVSCQEIIDRGCAAREDAEEFAA